MTNAEKYCWFLHDLPSPRHFLKWNYYFAVSSILARKVWFSTDAPIFPNLYIICVAPPAVGKSLPANMTKDIIESLTVQKVIPIINKIEERQLVNYSPNSLTVERLVESLSSCIDNVKVCDNPVKYYVHSSMTFYITEELTTLFKIKQEDLVDFLVAGWNCGSFKRETKSGDRFNIKQMCINFFGCTTVERLSRCVNSELISQGFTSRTLFLYGDKPFHRVPVINASIEQREALKEVIEHWKKIGKLCGQVKLTAAANDFIHHWITTEMDRHLNKDKKVEDYYGRKYHHLVKLAMVTHFSESTSMELDVSDFKEGLKQLELIEIDMHKSLKSIGRNPIHTLAEDIKRCIELVGELSDKQILAKFYDSGNNAEITEALQHKVAIGEFFTRILDGRTIYSLAKPEEGGESKTV